MTIDKFNYVDTAEKTVKGLIEKDWNGRNVIRLTTSKIRGILSMVSELYTEAQHSTGETLPDDLASRVQYLKMRVAYEAGREPQVRSFAEKAKLMENIADIGRSREKLILFCNYMEALVAYHRYYGGKD